MTVSEIFSSNCRGSIFDLPCPDSFVRENRMVGNLIVEADPLYGGGHLSVSGTSPTPLPLPRRRAHREFVAGCYVLITSLPCVSGALSCRQQE